MSCSASEFEESLEDFLACCSCGEFELPNDNHRMVFVDKVRTFEAVGILTRDRGLVITLSDGAAFQLTIAKVPQ